MQRCKSPSALSSVAPLLISTRETPREQPEPGKQQTAAKDAVTMLPQPRHHLSQPVSLRHPKFRATATARKRGGRPSRNKELRIPRGLGWYPGLEMDRNKPPPGSSPVISPSRIKKRLAEAQHTGRNRDQQMNTQGLREIRRWQEGAFHMAPGPGRGQRCGVSHIAKSTVLII